MDVGVLYRYDPDGSVHRMIEGVIIPNGNPPAEPTNVRHWMVIFLLRLI